VSQCQVHAVPVNNYTGDAMHIRPFFSNAESSGVFAELAAAAVSALAGLGLVLMLAFFLWLESWVLAATALR
jgi:hypothetical protein